jgi:feruloyl esterase
MVNSSWVAQEFFKVLQMGYATVGTDTGHQAHSPTADWALNNLDRLVRFGHQLVG